MQHLNHQKLTNKSTEKQNKRKKSLTPVENC